MKHSVRFSALAGALLLATAAFAQAEPVYPVPVAEDHPIWNDPLMDLDQVSFSAEYLTSELHLSEQQAAQMRDIEADINAQLLATDELEPGQRVAREEALRADRAKREHAVLNKEQQDQLRVMKRSVLRERAAKLAIEREAERKAKK